MTNKFRKSSRGENKGATRNNNKNKISLETQHQNSQHFVASMPKMVGQIVPRKEVKFVDVATASYNIDTTTSMTALNLIAEGDDYNTRNGRSIRVIGLQLRAFGLATVGTGVPQLGRVILFWDNATKGVLPSAQDVLAASSPDSFNPYNMSNVNRFTILYDHQFCLDVYTTSYSRATEMSANIKLNSTTRYLTANANIAAIQSGGLFMLVIGAQTIGSTAGTLTAWTRVQYVEEQ